VFCALGFCLGSVVVPVVHSRLGRACCDIWCYVTCLRWCNQLYLSCRTDEANLSVAALERCVTAISHWMSANRLKLNMEKTEWLWTGTGSSLDWLPESARRLTLGNDMIDVADAVRVLEIVVMPDLSLDKHVTAVSSKCSCRQLRRVRRSLDVESVATSPRFCH